MVAAAVFFFVVKPVNVLTARRVFGDPIEIGNRFKLGHGERDYSEMLAHFKDYNDIVGDHPLNLVSTTLALNAYMLNHEEKYKKWLLEYVDAWRERNRTATSRVDVVQAVRESRDAR